MPSSVSCVRAVEGMSEEYKNEAQALFEKYYPRDEDPELTVEEKTALMHEWYEHHYALMFREGLTRDILHLAGTGADLELREGAYNLVRICGMLQIPFVVLSAGLGDVTSAFFQKVGLGDAVQVVSNFFDYTPEGLASSLRHSIIHTRNKHLTHLQNHILHFAERPPTHVIVMGDHIGDSRMAECFPDATVLGIGIVAGHMMHMVPEYQERFDALLFSNDSLAPVEALLQDLQAR